MKSVVTHISPDLDALTAYWLICRFLPEWDEAGLIFVPAGNTLDNHSPDVNPDIIHVDTGMGQFDHHQTNEYTSASKRVLEFLVAKGYIEQKISKPLERLISFVNAVDHFDEIHFPDPTSDRYDFCLYQIVEELQPIISKDVKMLNFIRTILDAELKIFIKKTYAEKDIKKGLIFRSSFGRCLAMETANETSVKLAMKMGFALVIRKDPQTGSARIKTAPEKQHDLTPVYKKITALDKKGTWFLHVSKHMLLNASSRNPTLTPTSLSLAKLVSIIQNLYPS